VRAILHVGDMKCGSKSIQGWLAANERVLRDHGFYRSAATNWSIYDSGLACYALDDGEVVAEPRKEQGIRSANEVPGFRHSLEARLAAEVAAAPAGARAMVFSHEMLLMLEPAAVERVVGLLRGLFTEIHVVAYLRRQDRLFLSLWGQRLKTHDPGPRFSEDLLTYRRYLPMLEIWERFVGRDNLAVRVFDRRAFVDGDLLADFRRVAGVPSDPRYQMPAFANESLDAASQSLLLELRDRIQDQRTRHRRRLASRLRRLLRLESRHAGPITFPDSLATFLWQHGTGTGLRPSRAWAERIVAACDAENEEIRRRYCPERPHLFDSDMSDYPQAGGEPGEGYPRCDPEAMRREPFRPPEPEQVDEAYRIVLERQPSTTEIESARQAAANVAHLYARLLATRRPAGSAGAA